MSGLYVTTYSSAKNVTPSDTVLQNFKELYIGGTGNLTILDAGGNSVLFTALPVGARVPVHTSKVMSTGTTATLIVGMS